MRIRKITLEGDPYSRGLQHAEQLGAVMEVYAFKYFSKRRALGDDRVKRIVRHYLKFLKRCVPEEVREMEGLADGLNLPLERVLEHNLYTELPVAASLLNGCSCIGKVSDNRVLLGKNNDGVPTYPDAHILYHVKPDSGYENMYVAFTGMTHQTSCNGINSEGFSIAGASIGPVKMEFRFEAVPRGIFIKHILQYSANVDDAISILKRTLRKVGVSSGANCIFGDISGRLVAVEFTDKDFYIEEAEDGIAFRTNHPVSEKFSLKLIKDKKFLKGLENSRRRFETLSRLLRDSYVEVDEFKKILRYHGEPANICQHVGQKGAVMNTGASFIMDPCRKEMHVLQGFPCQEEYQTFRL
ncbi:hypothetical protein CW702_01655 [Candidatus Bathyarchaeota archaeon]|nr:MAG: hypothetical protein CW702_01655 [Candidatus Bathyarchaeota archaeon]